MQNFLRSTSHRRMIICLVLLAGLLGNGYAQEVSSGITGRITDPSGATIPGVEITARDQDRGTTYPTISNQEGVYAFPRIPPGTYQLKFEFPGFKSVVRSDIQLEVNQRARVDVALELGEVTDSVEVTGAPPLLQTETTMVGASISDTTLTSIPLVSRNYIEGLFLTPGVTTTNPAGMRNGLRTTGGGRPYVNGNRKEANNFLLDGIDNNQVSDNLTSYQPNIDAIQEVKMITNNASAEFGNFQGGIVNVVMKSGTNGLHGSVFEFFRDDALNANNWARNWQNRPRAEARWHTFGGTIGGPIVQDKLFFFGNYQGIRRSSPATSSSISVIPDAFRRGDFSRLLTERGIQLYDPANTDAQGNRLPFVNNQVPLHRINPVALALFNRPDLYPKAENNDLRFNQTNTSTSKLLSDQGDIKIDFKATEHDDYSFRYSQGRQDQPSTSSFPLLFPGFSESPFHAGMLNWTKVLGNSLINEMRVGVNRIVLLSGGGDKGLGNIADQLGILSGNERGPGLMSIQFTGGLASNIGNTAIGVQTLFANTTVHVADNFTVIKGRHMMKMGGQLLRQHMNTFYGGNNGRTGFIRFTGQFTQGPDPRKPSAIGFPEADFFLGLPTRIGRGLDSGTWGHRKNIIGLYFQDDWRATNSLTLNLGIRWEFHSPLVEVKDRQSNFEPLSGKLLLAGKDGNSRALYEPFYRDFQPRIGFAWSPQGLGGLTVIRGAYTISSFMEGTGTNLRLPLNPPFNFEFEGIYEGRLFPGSTLTDGLTALRAADPFKGANIRLWDPFVRPANTQQWNLTLEQQLPSAMVLSLGYVGQHGTHLVVPMPYFQKRLKADGTTERSPFLAGNPQLAQIAQISGTASGANQRYDSLQTSLRKRMSGGLEFQTSYTYSKGMSDAIGYYGEGGQSASQSAYWQNLYDQRAEWGPTYFDATHMLIHAFALDLPFGRGQRYGAAWNGLTDAILGGWQLSGILNLRGGFPLTVTALDRSGTTSRGPRADRLGNGEGPKQVGPGSTWLDKGAFKQPVTGTFGNSGVGVIRGPGLSTFDLSIQKLFRVKEGHSLELRGEFFNLTNTPAFGAPNRAVHSTTFGEITSAQGERNIQLALKYMF